MDVEETAIAQMLADSDQALVNWYSGFMANQDEDLVLTGVKIPSPDKLAAIFDQWCTQSRSLLQTLLCEKLGYARIEKGRREATEIGLIAVTSAALQAANLPGEVDPLTTAVLLYTRRKLDNLCPDEETATAEVE
ncbi:hypothetical protein GCM10009839_19030 [Catenulispora yoronensis]|uniref:TetR family transcriptional regulator n=1 Tax=Catenulispora yoronensis TaxID=450799 RepID=A0ABP5FDU3_9ACTN